MPFRRARSKTPTPSQSVCSFALEHRCSRSFGKTAKNFHRGTQRMSVTTRFYSCQKSRPVKVWRKIMHDARGHRERPSGRVSIWPSHRDCVIDLGRCLSGTGLKEIVRMSRAMLFSSLMAITCGSPLHAQTQPASPGSSRPASDPAAPRVEFEVASIKPNLEGSGDFSWDTAPNGHVTIRNLDVYNLIRGAYGLRDLQILGGPAWIKNRHYDIQAQPRPSGATVTRASQSNGSGLN
jgi:hypothetical protein